MVSIPERVSADLRHRQPAAAAERKTVSIPERVSADLRLIRGKLRFAVFLFQSLRGFQPI